MKTYIHIGLSALLYTLLLVVVALYVPMANVIPTMALLVAESIFAIYAVRQKKMFLALGCQALMLVIIASQMSPIGINTVLGQFDYWCAQHIGSHPTLIAKGVVILSIAICFSLLNVVIGLWQEKKLGVLSLFFGATTLPTTLIIIFVSYGHVRNSKESFDTSELIMFAEKKVEAEKLEVIEPVVTSSSPTVVDKKVEKKIKGVYTYDDLPADFLDQIKKFENAPLFLGKIKVDVMNEDNLKPGVMQVGYCITKCEISEAIRLGYLPKGAKLPKRMTKAEADLWFKTITVPTYLAQVREVLNPKVKLTPRQTVGPMSFCHNLGKGNLRLLIAQPGRLNDGNLKSTLVMMLRYDQADGKPCEGLAKRRRAEQQQLASK